MTDSIWLDFILLALILVFGVLFFILESDSLSVVSLQAKDGDALKNHSNSYWFYPQSLIRQCGLSVERSRLLYWALKYLSVVVALMVLLEMISAALPWWVYCLAAFGAFWICDIWLLLKRQRRRNEVSRSMLFFVELLIVNLRSGFGLNQAFRNAAEYGLSAETALAKETALVASELDAGRDRSVAFIHLSERTGVAEMQRLAAIINIGSAVGAPVADALEAQAQLLRMQQKQNNAAMINRKSLETLLPMLMICFPMFLVLVFFPAGLQIMQLLNLLKDIL